MVVNKRKEKKDIPKGEIENIRYKGKNIVREYKKDSYSRKQDPFKKIDKSVRKSKIGVIRRVLLKSLKSRKYIVRDTSLDRRKEDVGRDWFSKDLLCKS